MENKKELNENEVEKIAGGVMFDGDNDIEDMKTFMRMIRYTDFYYKLVKMAKDPDSYSDLDEEDFAKMLDNYANSPSLKFNVTMKETAPKIGKNFVKMVNNMLKDAKEEN